MSGLSYYTAEGLDRLKTELAELKTKGRANMARQIAEARDKGDLSENAEYDAAKEAQGLMEMKISKLEEVVGNARVLDESAIDLSKASLLTTVKIRNIKNKAEMKYTLVSEEEADLKAKKLSIKSPIGMALLGKVLGDKVMVNAPAGQMEFEILEIGLD
jgi:transcription elongation factor GreA